MNPYIYKPLFLHFVVFLSVLQAVQRTPDTLSEKFKNNDRFWIIIISISLVLWLGLRPINVAFQDTCNYAIMYSYLSINEPGYEGKGDWLFMSIMYWFKKNGLGVNLFFLFVEAVYMYCSAYVCTRLFKFRPMVAYVAILASFSFYSYAVNGLRQGMACAIMLVVLALVKDKKWILSGILGYFAVGTHNSVLLLIAAIVLAFFYKNTKVYFSVWLVCIVLSAFSSGMMEAIFQSIGFLDTGRSAEYLDNANADMSQFSSVGFRYDFLLYSAIPIFLGVYEVYKGYKDDDYKLILNTYIITNSFWVLVNRSWLSNRIAYLSWFMYAIVLIYPYLKQNNVPYRQRKLFFVLLGNAAFSYVMWLFGKYM